MPDHKLHSLECSAYTAKVEEANGDETSLCYILRPMKAGEGMKHM